MCREMVVTSQKNCTKKFVTNVYTRLKVVKFGYTDFLISADSSAGVGVKIRITLPNGAFYGVACP